MFVNRRWAKTARGDSLTRRKHREKGIRFIPRTRFAEPGDERARLHFAAVPSERDGRDDNSHTGVRKRRLERENKNRITRNVIRRRPVYYRNNVRRRRGIKKDLPGTCESAVVVRPRNNRGRLPLVAASRREGTGGRGAGDQRERARERETKSGRRVRR